MGLNKRKRIFYNLVVGILGKILLLILGFLVPKLYIENYGSEINGLLSSIAQVFFYLSLLEAGIGTAATQALYEPLSNNDTQKINGIMSAASHFYKRTGLLYGIGVIIFAFVFPLVVDAPVESITIFLLIILSGANSVINFLFQSKYFSLLNAEGKAYVHIAITTSINILTILSKVVLLSLKLDIVLIYTVYFLLTLLQNLAIGIYIKRNYHYLNCCSTPDKESLKQSSSVLVHQISTLVFSHTDVLVLTVFCNLNTVSIYTLYNMVTENIAVILTIIFSSFTAALGLTFQEDKERFKNYFDLFELGTWILSFSIMTITLLLFSPFISMYTANADIVYTDQWLPLLFVSCKLLSLIRMPGVYAINVAGHFKLTQTRTIIEIIINIVVSLVCVQFFGIYGVLFGTLAALLYRTIDIIVYTNRHIVYRDPFHITKRLFANAVPTVGIVLIAPMVIPSINTVVDFTYVGLILTSITFAVLLLVNYLNERKNESCHTLKQLVVDRLRKRY